MAHPVYRTAAWARVRRYVLARDANRCQIQYPGCTTWATEVDHIIPHNPDHGGAHYDPLNLQAACKICNAKKRWRDGEQPYAEQRAW